MMRIVILILMAVIMISADGTERTGTIFKDCTACPEMVVIPPGTFTMGSPETEKYREEDEGQHRVTIAYSFAASKAPVTWDQWGECVRDAQKKMVADAWKKMDAADEDGKKKPHMYHIVTNPHIEFTEEDHARYHAYWMGVLETGGEVVTAGREVNELVKVKGRWRIKVRDVNPGN